MKLKYLLEGLPRGNGYNNTLHMSVNAVNAYQGGEKPLNKWTKSEFLKSVKEIKSLDYNKFKNLTKEQIRIFLERTAWHHTGTNYKKTDFYDLNLTLCQMLSDGDFDIEDVVYMDFSNSDDNIAIKKIKEYIDIDKLRNSGFNNFTLITTFIKSLGDYGNGSYGILNKQEIKKYSNA